MRWRWIPLLLLTSPGAAIADLILDQLEIERRTLTLQSRQVNYNADADTFALSRYSSNSSYGTLTAPEVSFALDSTTDLFIGNVSEDGTMLSGTFTLVGTMPELGITTPTLLIQANAVGYDLTISNVRRQGNTEQAFLNHRIILENEFSHELLNWGTHTVINNSGSTGNDSTPFPAAPLNEDTLFTKSWGAVAGLFTYYSSARLISVAAPNTLLLLGIGLLVISFRSRSCPS